MLAISASAPGKIILFGEHAVVYGRPAIAIPVTQVQVKVSIQPDLNTRFGDIWIDAPEIGLSSHINDLPCRHPIKAALRCTLAKLKVERLSSCQIHIHSTIPVAAGLGSGAAVTVALARAVSGYLGLPLLDGEVSEIAYKIDQIHHGTPSGIDNTVIAYSRPVFFIKGQPFEHLRVEKPFSMVIANSGIHSPTGVVVGDVRKAHEATPTRYEKIFDQIAEIVVQARQMIENGQVEGMGELMTKNHRLLGEIDVSCPKLDQLVEAALTAGASGAKLCGGGRGGNMIALVEEDHLCGVKRQLKLAGASNVIASQVLSTDN